MTTTPLLLRALALGQLLVAGLLWNKDHGIALTFIVIGACLWIAALPRTPFKSKRRARR